MARFRYVVPPGGYLGCTLFRNRALTVFTLCVGTPVCTSLSDLKNQLKFIGIENVEAMFKTFSRLMEHTGDRSQSSRRGSRLSHGRVLGHFMFMMRAVMIRHSQQQKYNGTNTTLMQLPPKTQRNVVIEFSKEDKAEYKKLEKAAQDFYRDFRNSHSNLHGKFCLKLTQKLTPMRVACAGGKIPLEAPASEDAKEEEAASDDTEMKGEEATKAAAAKDKEGGDDDSSETEGTPRKREKKEVIYSDFAFTAKVKTLIEELSAARDKDPSSKSLVFSQYQSSLEYLQEELPNHGFQFRTLSGSMSMKARAKALSDFQQDPPTTIFLLSMRASACGINLTQANRVFMLEPGKIRLCYLLDSFFCIHDGVLMPVACLPRLVF